MNSLILSDPLLINNLEKSYRKYKVEVLWSEIRNINSNEYNKTTQVRILILTMDNDIYASYEYNVYFNDDYSYINIIGKDCCNRHRTNDFFDIYANATTSFSASM